MSGTENNYQTYQGQELEEELGKDTYAYQWRDYDPAIARFNKVDRFAEKYVSHSPYAFVKNNPIRFREIAGDSIAKGASTRRAKRMERRSERRAARLDRRANRRAAKGKNVGDMRERAVELRQSAQDIRDMRSDPTNWYRFERVNSSNNALRDANGNGLPVTYRTDTNEVTMFMTNFRNMHEPRHGGQLARGAYDIIGVGINGVPTSSYGAQEEISAYRAEYSSISGMGALGSLKYLPSFTPTNADALRLVTKQATMMDIYKQYQQSVNNINNINAGLLRNMHDTNGFSQNPIYLNRPTIWWNN